MIDNNLPPLFVSILMPTSLTTKLKELNQFDSSPFFGAVIEHKFHQHFHNMLPHRVPTQWRTTTLDLYDKPTSDVIKFPSSLYVPGSKYFDIAEYNVIGLDDLRSPRRPEAPSASEAPLAAASPAAAVDHLPKTEEIKEEDARKGNVDQDVKEEVTGITREVKENNSPTDTYPRASNAVNPEPQPASSSADAAAGHTGDPLGIETALIDPPQSAPTVVEPVSLSDPNLPAYIPNLSNPQSEVQLTIDTTEPRTTPPPPDPYDAMIEHQAEVQRAAEEAYHAQNTAMGYDWGGPFIYE